MYDELYKQNQEAMAYIKAYTDYSRLTLADQKHYKPPAKSKADK